eukprot:CAMPEP_0198682998 /NCGR_PEP_ID=MMETSP1468-20131203/9846_1 /TAXON_ID=1461545 /ORGANISM="Mantoniella sp, Strain CCMP1436" /LENGTH=264 /DNA_ID=CAMNT_0044426599 /DNA_START=123 /DNA_END=917 /DNA_ORIENTATION=+
MAEALELMPKGLQIPSGAAPTTRKKVVQRSPDECTSWNFLTGDGPSAPPPSAAPRYFQEPKPFKPGWKERRKEPSIQPAAVRHEDEQRVAAREAHHAGLRFDLLSDRRDYTGVDPIKGTVRDETKATTPSYSRRGMPERSAEATEREARKAVSAEARLALKRTVLVNEGLAGPHAKGARVRDNFDASLYNPRAAASAAASVPASEPASRAASASGPGSRAAMPSAAAKVDASPANSRASTAASASRAMTANATAREVAEVAALP